MKYTQEEIEIVCQNTIEDSMRLLGCCKRKVGKIRQWVKDLEYSNYLTETSEAKLEGEWENSRMKNEITVIKTKEEYDEEARAMEIAVEASKKKILEKGKLDITPEGFMDVNDIAAYLEMSINGEIPEDFLTRNKEEEEIPEEEEITVTEKTVEEVKIKITESGKISSEDLMSVLLPKKNNSKIPTKTG